MLISIYNFIFKRRKRCRAFCFPFLFNILTFILWLNPKSYSELDSSLLMGQKACKLLPVSTAGLIATNSPQQIYRPHVSALLHPPHAILPTSHWAKRMWELQRAGLKGTAQFWMPWSLLFPAKHSIWDFVRFFPHDRGETEETQSHNISAWSIR